MNVSFEVMAEKHRAGVMSVFNYHIEHGFAAYPETKLPESFFDRLLEITKGYPAFVLRDDATGETVGFCFLHAYNPFSSFKKTAEISYFLMPDHTGKGVGTVALERLQNEARKTGIRRLLASVSSKNTQSLTFHAKNGFSECGRLKDIGEKNGVPFDVVWMQKELV